jgi:hypothetical protein
VLEPGQNLDRLVDDIGYPLDGDPPAPALRPRVRALRHQLGPGLRGNPAREIESFLAQGTAGQQQQTGLTRA